MVLKIPRLSEKQIRFCRDLKHKYLGFGGSRGGGKSFALRVLTIILCLMFPGIKVLIIRKTYPELISNHINPLVEMLGCYSKDPERKFASYNDQRKTMTFPNGSVIMFRYCDSEKDVHRFQGLECDALLVDEATQHSEEVIKKLTACVRGVNQFPKIIRFTCNPGGEGHQWFKRLFIDRIYNAGENPDDYDFIQSSVYDNKALMATNPDYVKQLEALPPHLRDMWLHGNWDIFEGQFFEDFRLVPDVQAAYDHGCNDDAEKLLRDRRWTHVIEPFDMSIGEPHSWKILRSFDWGYNKPFSCGWWAIDYDGVMYRILELYGCTDTPNEGVKWTKAEVFKEIARIEREHPWLKGRKIDGVADPAIFSEDGGPSIAETAEDMGVYFDRGDNSRVAGWAQFHYRLQFDENGFPRMYVFNTCKAFIRTVPLMIYDEHHPEDLDTELEDHVSDEARYAFMSRPIEPMRPVIKKTVFFDPLDQFKKGAI